ncbi:MAG: hypothetical protein Q9195_006552 [Heterodermia aff. obscurata]
MESTVVLEATFFAGIVFTGIACYYGRASFLFVLFATIQSVFLTGLLLWLWPSGQPRRFHATRSACTKHKVLFVEFCVFVHLICACLSLLGRLHAARFVPVTQSWLPALTLSTIMVLELIASLAVVLAHATGHHDFCVRVKWRIIWLGRGLRSIICLIGNVFHCMLQEVQPDLEGQSRGNKVVTIWPSTKNLTAKPVQEEKSKGIEPQEKHGDAPDSETEGVNRLSQQKDIEHLGPIRRAPSTYDMIHQELRSIGARLRWSAVRYVMFPKLQKTPFQDLSLLVAVHPQAYSGSGHLHQSQPLYQLSGRPRINTSHSSPQSMTSVVTNIIDQNNALGISQFQPLEYGEQLRPRPRPFIQLPGVIQNVRVEALPDTGSSQNVINASFLEHLNPAACVISSNSDKPLRAPDEELIPCEGKVYLPWAFENESETWHQWFYVVRDCSYDVIIGNGFLRETETMEKHQDRLKITEPSDPDSLPGNLVSEAQELDRLRQVVVGKVNGERMTASLDTGCEANLMSQDCARTLDLEPTLLPTEKRVVTFANGRTGTTLGWVEVQWSFADTPDIQTKVKCYVLPKCIHSIIFGARFAVLEKPWEKHTQALKMETLDDAGDAGVVDLKKNILDRFIKPKENPQAAAQQKLKDEKHDRLEGLLASPASTQMPALPPRAIVAPSATGSSTQAGVQSSAASIASQTPTLISNTAANLSSSAQVPTAGGSIGQLVVPGAAVTSQRGQNTSVP